MSSRITSAGGSTLSFRGNRGVLKRGDGPTLLLLRHYEGKHPGMRLLRGTVSVTAHVNHRNVRSQETNLFHLERESRVLVDRVEDLLVRRLDHRSSLDVHAV